MRGSGAGRLVAGLIGAASCWAATMAVAEEPGGGTARIERLLRGMTLEEKVGQLNLLSTNLDVTGPRSTANLTEAVRRGEVGAVFNAFGADFTRELQRIAVEETRLGVPLVMAYDVIHGYRTIFPIPLGQAAAFDPGAVERAARVAAAEATAAGVAWTFAPMVDVARDPRWGRIAEGAGEDPYLGSLVAAAAVHGYQGDDLAAPDTLAATVKHFAAYGAAEAGRDYNTVDLSERRLREVYLPPFAAGIEAGAAAVMPAFNELNGVPATADPWLLTDLLRGEWGFDGLLVSDYNAVAELVPHGVVADAREAAAQALLAGLDMDMQSEAFVGALPVLVREGRIEEARIDAAVRRVLELKERLGLLDDPYRYGDPAREAATLLRPEHLEAARDVARRSIVLLKNDDGLLPLRKDLGTVAVIGPLADSRLDVLGSWAAAGRPDEAVSLLAGITAKVAPGTRVLHAAGGSIGVASAEDIAEAVAAAEAADAVVLALGESATMSGEAASRASIEVPAAQVELARAVLATGRPVAVVLMSGRPLAIEWLDREAPAVLAAWFGGTQAGHAVADVLFGDHNPSGRLPVGFPRHVGQVPVYYAHKPTGRPAGPAHYTSKYLDVPNEPLYPFGYGLSYTTFAYSGVRLGAAEMTADGSLEVSVEVANTGAVAGEETVQLYLRDLVGSVTRPVRELKGFRRIALGPGERRTVAFTLTARDLAFLRRDMTVGVEAGRFEVYVGPDSTTTNGATFRLLPSES